MIDQRLADRLARALHNVDHAGRNPRLKAKLPQHDRRHRRLLRRLEHDGVSTGDCRDDLPDRRRGGPFHGTMAAHTPIGSRVV